MLIRFILLCFCLPAIAAAADTPRAKSLPFFESGDFTPYWDSDAKAAEKKPATVLPFNVVDQAGHAVSEKAMNGKVSVVNFFFCGCGSVCPTMMRNLKTFKQSWAKQYDSNKDLQIFSFTITPEEDTPKVLREYAQQHKLNLDRWSLLTGERNEIFRIGKNMFKADRTVAAANGEKSFTHSQNLYLVDSSLRIRGVYDSGKSEEMKYLAQDIRTLLENNVR